MLGPVVQEIERCDAEGGSALVFTNVRSQAEAWYQQLLGQRPEWAGRIALHHGSLDKSVREWVEAGLKAGTLLAVVATSSLDLGVDFLPVDRVLQLGSARAWAPTPSTTAWPRRTGSTPCPTGALHCATGCRWAPSSASRRCW